MRELIETLGLPTLTTWIGADLLEYEHPLYVGRCGTVAQRGANFSVQNADLVLAIGCRMDFSITGFNRSHFARQAEIVVVDIDPAEIAKLGDMPDERFVCDAVARGSHRLVFLCTKMPDFERAIHGLATDDDGERIYVTTQNGLAAPQMCAALFGKDRVLAGATVVNAQRTDLGVVEVFSDVRQLNLAPLHPAAATVAREVAARLAQAGIETQVAPSADGLLWEKFVGLEPLATACAVTQLALGELRSQPIALKFLRGLFDEVFDVAHAAGAELASDAHVRRWQAYLDGPPAMRPSLAIDVAAGRSGELDWLTGEVVRLAERHAPGLGPLGHRVMNCFLDLLGVVGREKRQAVLEKRELAGRLGRHEPAVGRIAAEDDALLALALPVVAQVVGPEAVRGEVRGRPGPDDLSLVRTD